MAPKGYDRVMVEHDIGRNRKLRRHFKPEERWAYLAGVVCIAGAAPIRGTFAVGHEPADEHDVADIADVKLAVARKTVAKLRELGMLVSDPELGCDRLYGFDERNPPPKKDPTGAERQRRFRERNASVTVPDTVTHNGGNSVTDTRITPPSHGHNAPEVEEEGKEKKETSVSFTPETVELSQQLADAMLRNDPKARVAPDSQRWLDALRLLVNNDGRTVEEVRAVIDWCQSSEFWRSIILSPSKLREKFPDLVLQMRRKPLAVGRPVATGRAIASALNEGMVT